MKKLNIIVLIVLMLISVTACDKKNMEQTEGYKFAEEYNSINGVENASGKKYRDTHIPSDNPMVHASMEEIVEKIKNKETFAVYFGFAGCPWCRSMVEELVRSAKDNNQEKVYYVNVSDTRDKYELDSEGNPIKIEDGDEYYNELINLLGDVLSDYTLTNELEEEISVGEKRIYAPNVVAIVRGKAEKMIEGTSSKLTDPYGELTDEMREESYNSLKCIWECLNDVPVCKKNAC